MDDIQTQTIDNEPELETEEVETEVEEKPTLRDAVTKAYEAQVDKDLDKVIGDEPEAQPAPKVPEAPKVQAKVPISWSKEDKEDFLTLKPEVQNRILEKESKRDKIFNQFLERQAAFEKAYPGLDDIVKPYRDQWARAGVAPTQVFNQFLEWQKYLDRDSKAALRELAASYGHAPKDLEEDATERPGRDPAYTAIQKELHELKSSITNQQQQSQQGFTSQINSAIESFATQVDAQGQAVRPHFDRLYSEGRLAPIVGRLQNENPKANFNDMLQQAYDEASWAHPEIRSQMIQAEDAKRNEGEREKAQRARRAASSVSGGPGISAPQGQRKPLRQTLSDKYDELMNGI